MNVITLSGERSCVSVASSGCAGAGQQISNTRHGKKCIVFKVLTFNGCKNMSVFYFLCKCSVVRNLRSAKE